MAGLAVRSGVSARERKPGGCMIKTAGDRLFSARSEAASKNDAEENDQKRDCPPRRVHSSPVFRMACSVSGWAAVPSNSRAR